MAGEGLDLRQVVRGNQHRGFRRAIEDRFDELIANQSVQATGIRATFTNEVAQQYDGRIEVAVEVRQQRANYRDGIATAIAVRQRSVLENISLNDRERVWYDLTFEMMRDIDNELDRQINANLTRFLA